MSDPELNQERLRRLRQAIVEPIFFHNNSVFWCGETASTNDDCRRLAEGRPDQSIVVIADRQSAGRGQYGRRWETPPALGLLMSFSLPGTPPHAVALSAWGAAATAVMLETKFGLRANVKWPNDVLVSGRKIAGVLVEVGGFAVIGIGLNVLQQPADFPEDCRLPPTSIAIEKGYTLDRVDVAAALLQELELMATPSIQERLIFNVWQERLDVQQGEIAIATLNDETSVQGEFLEMDLQAGLRLKTRTGTIRVPLERLVRLEKSV